MVKLFVHVCLHMRVIHHRVDLNVSAVQNVHQTKLVSTKNVLIHVLAHAAKMLIVKLYITVRFVRVELVLLEIRSQDVIQYHVIIQFSNFHPFKASTRQIIQYFINSTSTNTTRTSVY